MNGTIKFLPELFIMLCYFAKFGNIWTCTLNSLYGMLDASNQSRIPKLKVISVTHIFSIRPNKVEFGRTNLLYHFNRQ